MNRAECHRLAEVEGAEVVAAIFFPTREDGPDTWNAAKEVCGRCPVSDACLEYAVANKERVGVWGGTTGDERRVLIRSRHGAKEASITDLSSRIGESLAQNLAI